MAKDVEYFVFYSSLTALVSINSFKLHNPSQMLDTFSLITLFYNDQQTHRVTTIIVVQNDSNL